MQSEFKSEKLYKTESRDNLENPNFEKLTEPSAKTGLYISIANFSQ